MKRQFFSKRVPFLTKFFFFMFIVLLGYAVIAQTVIIPHEISGQYDQQLNPDFKQVRAKFNAVSKSTELAAYNDPYSDPQLARNDLLATQQLIAETQLTLQNYEQRANMLATSPFARLSGKYKKAEVVRERAHDVFLQSREVLDGHKELTTYLIQVNTARAVLKNNTTDINGLVDLNRLAGQGDVLAARATQLSSTVDTLKHTTPPKGFEDYHAALVDSFEQSLAGLQQFSQGLLVADDNQINSGARVLERAILKIETNDNTLFATAAANSATLKETSQLVDKIDSLQPFLDQ